MVLILDDSSEYIEYKSKTENISSDDNVDVNKGVKQIKLPFLLHTPVSYSKLLSHISIIDQT